MTNIKVYIIIFFSLALTFTFFSCGHSNSDGEDHTHDDKTDQYNSEDHELNEHVHLTKEQIETMNIQFGDFSQIKISDIVEATGTLGLPPNALTAVSAKASGYIRDSDKFVEGDYIIKGNVLAYLENPEFIKQQQRYLEVAAELVFDRQELSRQRSLLNANAGIERNVQELESKVARKTASLKGIAQQLAYVGISVGSLTTENIIERVPIYAPMTGYITAITMHNGMFVTPQIELMEIVNENHLHLELDVFENDIAHIEKGQPISYTVPALGNTSYKGEVHVIGKEFNSENKTVRIHGHLERERPRFIKDLFVTAKIWLNDQTVLALPEKAIMKDGDFSYIYVAEDNTIEEIEFERIRVLPSNTDNGFTAIALIDPIPDGTKIVTGGAYYVFAQSKSGELEHEH